MAWRHFKAGGITTGAGDPETAGHGIKMLPDVAKETTELLRKDPILKATCSTVPNLVLPIISRWAADPPNVVANEIARAEAYEHALQQRYLEDVHSGSIDAHVRRTSVTQGASFGLPNPRRTGAQLYLATHKTLCIRNAPRQP